MVGLWSISCGVVLQSRFISSAWPIVQTNNPFGTVNFNTISYLCSNTSTTSIWSPFSAYLTTSISILLTFYPKLTPHAYINPAQLNLNLANLNSSDADRVQGIFGVIDSKVLLAIHFFLDYSSNHKLCRNIIKGIDIARALFAIQNAKRSKS